MHPTHFRRCDFLCWVLAESFRWPCAWRSDPASGDTKRLVTRVKKTLQLRQVSSRIDRGVLVACGDSAGLALVRDTSSGRRNRDGFVRILIDKGGTAM